MTKLTSPNKTSIYFFLFIFSISNSIFSEIKPQIGCQLEIHQSTKLPKELFNTLKNVIIEDNHLDIVSHRGKYIQKVLIKLKFPVKVGQHFGLLVDFKTDQSGLKQLVLIPKKGLLEVKNEIAQAIVNTLMIEYGDLEGKSLNKNILLNIRPIYKTKEKLDIQFLNKNSNNKHFYSKLKQSKVKTILKRNNEFSNKSNIRFNSPSKSLLERLVSFANKKDFNKSSFARISSSGLASLLPQLSLNEYKIHNDMNYKCALKISHQSEDYNHDFGTYLFESKGDLVLANLLFSRKISLFTFGLNINAGKRDSVYTFNSTTNPIKLIYSGFSYAIGDTSLYGSIDLPIGKLPFEPFINLKVPTGDKKQLMSVGSTDLSLGYQSSLFTLDYQLAYTIVGSTDYLNFKLDKDVRNYFSMSVGKSLTITRYPDYMLSFVFYGSQSPLDRLNNIIGEDRYQISLGSKISKSFSSSTIEFETSIGLTDSTPDMSIGFGIIF